jgi:hypothetical protein
MTSETLMAIIAFGIGTLLLSAPASSMPVDNLTYATSSSILQTGSTYTPPPPPVYKPQPTPSYQTGSSRSTYTPSTVNKPSNSYQYQYQYTPQGFRQDQRYGYH